MIKHNEIIKKIKLSANKTKRIDLKKIYPLGKVECLDKINVELSFDGKKYFKYDVVDSFNNETARYIKITSLVDQTVTIYAGLGYVAFKNEEFEKHFVLAAVFSL